MEITVDAKGNFELEIVLNAVFCSEYDNKIPVIVSYTVDDGQGVTEIPFIIGVITYDYENGILRYPAGAEYISETGGKVLDKLYVPADAGKDPNGNVTVMYNDLIVTFKPNPMPVAEAPVSDLGSIADVSDETVTLNTVKGLEYGYIEVGGSITDGYGKTFNWQIADDETLEISDLEPGVTYTFWVRTPGIENELLPSAPVLLAKNDNLTADDADAKNAFLEKYKGVVKNGDELYSPEDPAVKASKEDTLQLLSLYNALSEEVKALDVIGDKGDYLLISNYLAKHQGVINAAKAADSYADLRTDYSYDDMNVAVEDFFDVMDDIKDAHLADEADGKFVFDLSFTMQKLYVLVAVDAVDSANDMKYEAVDYIVDLLASQYDEMSASVIEATYDGMQIEMIELAREDYELILFVKKYQSVFESDDNAAGITELESILAEMIELDINTSMGGMMAMSIYEKLNVSLNDLYIEELEKLLAKYDEDDDIYQYIEFVIGEIREVIPGDPDDVVNELYFPENKDYYDLIVRYAKLFDTYDSAIAELEGLKNGRSDQIIDILNEYIYNVESIYMDFDVDVLYESDSAEAYLANNIDAIKLVVTKAKTQLAFIDKKAAAKAEIEAMKDNNTAVIDAANKYLPEIDQISYDYNNVESLKANIDAVVAAAKAETDFEKKRIEVKSAVAADVTTKKASGRYSADQIAQLEAILAASNVLVDNVDFGANKTIADLDAEQAAALAKLASVNVISISAGSVPYSGDLSATDYAADYNLDNGLWGNVTNMNGFGSALALEIKKVATEDKLKVDKISVATGELTEEEAIAAAKDKAILLKLDITLGDVSVDNGLYTVKVLLPADVRDATGLYVVSQSGDTTYVYETTREGNFIVFKTANFSEFLLVGDKNVNLTWLVVVLAVLLVAEIAVIVFFIVKKKKGAAAAAIVPFLALAYVPAGVVPAVMVLGALAVVGAAAAATTTVQYSKKKN